MKLKLLITAALLALAMPAAADGRVVQEAYEVALSDIRLPRVEHGTIAFKECDKCDYVRYRVGSDTQYQLNGKALPLAKFRAAVRHATNPQDEAVTVLRHVERNQVTVVSVNL